MICRCCRSAVGAGFTPCRTCADAFCSKACADLHNCTVKLEAAIRQCDRVHARRIA